MKVRDRKYNIKEYKGHWCEAVDLDCPCRPCYNCHDCGYFLHGKWIESFECATSYNNGCPTPLPRSKHTFKMTKRFQNRKKGDVFICIRCGQKVKVGQGKFDFITV